MKTTKPLVEPAEPEPIIKPSLAISSETAKAAAEIPQGWQSRQFRGSRLRLL